MRPFPNAMSDVDERRGGIFIARRSFGSRGTWATAPASGGSTRGRMAEAEPVGIGGIGGSSGGASKKCRTSSQPAETSPRSATPATDAASLAARPRPGQKLETFMGRSVFFRMAMALVVLPLLLGCQRLERAQECRSVWKLVNPTLKEIDEQRQSKPEDVRTYETLAARYMLLSGALSQLKLEYKRLQEPVTEYQRILQDASHDARQFAEALTSKDVAKIASARANAGRTVKRENAATNKIDNACRQR